MRARLWLIVAVAVAGFGSVSVCQDLGTPKVLKSALPGHIDEPVGSFKSVPFDLESDLKCTKFRIVVPENRAKNNSRAIRLYGYRIQSVRPSKKAPVFVLLGGPGGFFDDRIVKALNKEPKGGTLREVWLFAQDRDVVLVNQRAARSPDKTFAAFGFLVLGLPLDQPHDYELAAQRQRESLQIGLKHWSGMGMDLAGYDIQNMIEDMNDIRAALEYEKIVLRGTSFGSQWSMAYMRKYPQHVDRAILGGVEPLDHGWDSADGFWNVFVRLQETLDELPNRAELGYPDVPLTEAVQAIVKRLEEGPITIKTKPWKGSGSTDVVVGVHDFQRYLMAGIGAHKEQHESFANLPKFVYEIYQENYSALANRVASGRRSISNQSLQLLLIDNSLGISKQRERVLDNEPARRWLGEVNLSYRASRDLTPTTVIDDSFRLLQTGIPTLMVQGDWDLSTPYENAEYQLEHLTNGHLIRVKRGTHGAIPQIHDHDKTFWPALQKFLDADLTAKSVAELELPKHFELPAPKFEPMSK